MLRHFQPTGAGALRTQEVKEFLRVHLIDADGLGETERNYLTVLRERGRASLDTLALQLGLDRDEVQHQLEQVLVRLGYVDITSKGRMLTPMGEQRIAGRGVKP
jgi:Holliday junction DNA helicase RuvB